MEVTIKIRRGIVYNEFNGKPKIKLTDVKYTRFLLQGEKSLASMQIR